MLHRAATSAYSWWWASHIRTKQSKWLEQNLQDMEEKVQFMLAIIEQEGDSFAKRAEMYYKKRPELINSVEESYRAYRALAERFDHISKDLQSANRTIATAFPEQVHLSMESDDDDIISASSTTPSPDRFSIRGSPPLPKNMPKAPKPPIIKMPNAKAQAMLASKKEQLRRNLTTSGTVCSNSGLSKEEALKEIDGYEKEILSMQTEKEFMKSAYESALAKFLELESKITESQTKVCTLQDEFGVGAVIEDHEARTLMAGSALSSCANSLAKLQDEQARSMHEVKEEYERIKEAHEKIESLKKLCRQKEEHTIESSMLEKSSKETLVGMDELGGGVEDVDALREKIKEQLKLNSNSTFTEPEMAEKIDDLVDKVISLETRVCSQNALVKRLRQEIDELLEHIKILEEQKQQLHEDSAMRNRVKELEEELLKIKSLNKEFVDKKNNIDVEITGASCNLDHLQEKLHDVKPYEDVEYPKELISEQQAMGLQKEEYTEKENYNSDLEPRNEVKEVEEEEEEKQDMSKTIESTSELELKLSEEDGINWRRLYMHNMEERERILVEEYTIILRDYKDMKTKLSEVEKKHKDNTFELATHVRELRNTIAAKDEEIQMLREKLSALQGNEDDITDSLLEENGGMKMEDRDNNKEIDILGSSQNSNPDRKPLFHHLYDKDILIIKQTAEENDKIIEAEKENGVKRVKINPIPKTKPISRTENRFRAQIDDLLEANLDFWLRFSTAFHQIQKFQTSIKDLQAELGKLKQCQKKGRNDMPQNQVKSDTRPLYKHLREIQTELTLWLEHSAVFQDELRSRFSSLNNIQDEITRVLTNNTKEENELSDYQAAKFQGEILNMKHENSKVAEELQAGVHRVKALKTEMGKALTKLDKEFGFSESTSTTKNPSMKPRIPLHTFLFGIKLKKHKRTPSQSMFDCVNSTSSKDHHSSLQD